MYMIPVRNYFYLIEKLLGIVQTMKISFENLHMKVKIELNMFIFLQTGNDKKFGLYE